MKTSMKISWRKLSQSHTIDRIWVGRACGVHEENFEPIRESFLPQKFPAIRYQFLEMVGKSVVTSIAT